LVRQLMKAISPTVVANAESISRNVLFFPVSSFGHAPVKVGPGDYVPDPRRLEPFMVEVPVLWLLSRIAPELLQSAQCPGNLSTPARPEAWPPGNLVSAPSL